MLNFFYICILDISFIVYGNCEFVNHWGRSFLFEKIANQERTSPAVDQINGSKKDKQIIIIVINKNLFLEKGMIRIMKDKKIAIFFITVLLIILIGGYFAIKSVKTYKSEEYTPQEEIAENQERQTIVSLYFPSKETNELKPEARLIDIKELINQPYEKLINLLIEGPKNEKSKKIIPENTKLNKYFFEGDCITLDFSNEFLNFAKEDKDNLINSIVNTLTELTEVNRVRFLIDGNENEEFNGVYERD